MKPHCYHYLTTHKFVNNKYFLTETGKCLIAVCVFVCVYVLVRACVRVHAAGRCQYSRGPLLASKWFVQIS